MMSCLRVLEGPVDSVDSSTEGSSSAELILSIEGGSSGDIEGVEGVGEGELLALAVYMTCMTTRRRDKLEQTSTISHQVWKMQKSSA